MARTLDPVAHALRREAFVDVAQRLIQTKGYEQMSVQDVLDDLDASKGAFYHYFGSKVALLEAVVERTVEQAMATLVPVVDDPAVSALQKLEGFFGGIARWKFERSELMFAVMRVWLSDENTVVRERLRQLTMQRVTPTLARIVRQGQAEGTFTASSAEHVAVVLVSLILGAQETLGQLYLALQSRTVSFDDVVRSTAAYTEAFERILGLPAGSWPTIDTTTLRFWFVNEEQP
jgi:AcrR family transcriptional regulator